MLLSRAGLKDGSFDKLIGLSRVGEIKGVTITNVGLDQSGQSDSNSENSAAESVATNRTSNLTMPGPNLNAKHGTIIGLPFIDFLGVGAA